MKLGRIVKAAAPALSTAGSSLSPACNLFLRSFVDFEQGINKSIRQIRDALNDDADRPRFIETLTRRGYRFIANVEYPETDPVKAHMDEPNRAAPASFTVETAELAESRPRILTRAPRFVWCRRIGVNCGGFPTGPAAGTRSPCFATTSSGC